MNEHILLVIIFLNVISTAMGQTQEIVRIFENCHKQSSEFDSCIKTGLNELRAFFKSGSDTRFGANEKKKLLI